MTKIRIQKLDTPNLNGRIYPRKTVEPFVGLDVVGGIGYESTELTHIVKNLQIDGDYLVGDLTITTTDKSRRNILDGLIDDANCGFRMYAIGSVNQNNEVTIDKLISIDLVTDPA